jgi:choline dehydrogenase-like flavoprotein
MTSDQEGPLTPEERRLRTLLRVLAVLFGLAMLAYLLPALGVFGATLRRFSVELPFVTNSVVKVATLGMLALLASGDVRRHRTAVVLLIAAHAISEAAMLAAMIFGDVARIVDPGPPVGPRPVRDVLLFAMVLDGVILTVLIAMFHAAERARYQLRWLSPMEYRALSALAEVIVIGDGEVLSAGEVARNTDRYLSSFRARSKWLAKLVLKGMQIYPLLTLRPPFSDLAPEERLSFLKKRFYRDIGMRIVPGFVRTLAQAAIRMAKQLCYLGYYADARTHAAVGYVPFSQRPDRDQRMARSPAPTRAPLRTLRPESIRENVLTVDVLIVGSGAAGSILAHRLATGSDREIFMIERGDHVDPSEFVEDEVEMLSRLYADGALQLSRDFRLQVLQGSCVGGTTVVNNAVCFRLPDDVLARWNDSGAGLDEARLSTAFDAVESLVRVRTQDNAPLGPGGRPFAEGLRRMGLDRPPHASGVIAANIEDCLGCGYCNIGCAYGRKLSMLDTVLPSAQAQAGADRVRVLAGCEAVRLRARGRAIEAVQCRLTDGRHIEIRARTVIVAAGAVSSPLLLRRSGIGGSSVGTRASFNIGSPVTAAFDERIVAYDGLQISHYIRPAPDRGFVLETWYNPPVAQALAMPGWFEDHFRNMRRYDRLAGAGVLVGSEPTGRIRDRGLTGREIDFSPSADDLRRVLDGVVLAGEVFLSGGAKSIMPATFEYHELESVQALRGLPLLVRDASDITLGTGHPMGGCAVSNDPSHAVVNTDFRVHGYDNLHLCDASVFPSAAGVNPQLTVMALAWIAADSVPGVRPAPLAAVVRTFVEPEVS